MSASPDPTPRRDATRAGGAALALAALVACSPGPAPPEAEPDCELELRSWVVAGWGRHLYLDCDCPEPHGDLSGRVEFTSVLLRPDREPGHEGRAVIARMTPGRVLGPILAEPRDRLEARYAAPVSVVRRLQEDAVFDTMYSLLGPNSNSALRAAMAGEGLALPRRVLESGAWWGEYPGVTMDPGPRLDHASWPMVGLEPPGGP